MSEIWNVKIDPLSGEEGEGGSRKVALATQKVEIELAHCRTEGVNGRDVGVGEGRVVWEGGREGGRRAGRGRHVMAARAVAEVATGCYGGGGRTQWGEKGPSLHAFLHIVVVVVGVRGRGWVDMNEKGSMKSVPTRIDRDVQGLRERRRRLLSSGTPKGCLVTFCVRFAVGCGGRMSTRWRLGPKKSPQRGKKQCMWSVLCTHFCMGILCLCIGSE